MHRPNLRPDEATLLREIITHRNPDQMGWLDLIGKVPLTADQREELRESLVDEFVATGLGDDFEPNERGLVIDHLIARLWHLSEDGWNG
jgi:hypothetical protein